MYNRFIMIIMIEILAVLYSCKCVYVDMSMQCGLLSLAVRVEIYKKVKRCLSRGKQLIVGFEQ